MTWTAGALVAELRHLDPDVEVFVLGPNEVDDIRGVIRPRRARHRRWPRIGRRIVRARVVRVDDSNRFAYLEVAP